MSELLKRQFLFSSLASSLTKKATELGFDVTEGETWRTPEQAAINALGEDGWIELVKHLGENPRFHALAMALQRKIDAPGRAGVGILLSVHCDRLAKDLNLFRNGIYQTGPDAYRALGEYWKGLHRLCRYGGDFRDYDHFSVESPSGRK